MRMHSTLAILFVDKGRLHLPTPSVTVNPIKGYRRMCYDTISTTFGRTYTYDATLTSPQGCVKTATIKSITVHPDPVANFSWNPITPSILNRNVNLHYECAAYVPQPDSPNNICIPAVRGIDSGDFGLLIFQNKRYGKGRYGTHKGPKAKQDVYVRKLKVKNRLNVDSKEYSWTREFITIKH